MKTVCNVGSGGAVLWWRYHLMEATQQLAGAQWEDERAARWEDESGATRGNTTSQPAQDNEMVAQWENDKKDKTAARRWREATQQPDGAMRRQEGGAVRGWRKDESAARREEETAAQQEATQQQPTCAIRQWEGSALRGQWEARWENEMAAWREGERAARRQATQQPAGTTRGQDGDSMRRRVHLYCSVNYLYDCCLILSPFNRGGVSTSRPSLSFCISIFLAELRCRMPIWMKWLFNLCFGDTPLMQAFNSLTPMGADMCPLKNYNFSKFCPLTTFDN